MRQGSAPGSAVDEPSLTVSRSQVLWHNQTASNYGIFCGHAEESSLTRCEVWRVKITLAQSSTKRVSDAKLDLNVPKSGAFVLDFVLE